MSRVLPKLLINLFFLQTYAIKPTPQVYKRASQTLDFILTSTSVGKGRDGEQTSEKKYKRTQQFDLSRYAQSSLKQKGSSLDPTWRPFTIHCVILSSTLCPLRHPAHTAGAALNNDAHYFVTCESSIQTRLLMKRCNVTLPRKVQTCR